MDKEMNFFDLCVVCGRAIGRAFNWCMRLLTRMCRLTYRYWWAVGVVVIMALAAAWYYTRPDNLSYRFNAVALLNGPTIQQFDQAFTTLTASHTLPANTLAAQLVKENKMTHLKTYRVIDCLHDGTADYIDFKSKSSPTDTVKVQMQDRICIQFRVKKRNLDSIPEMESAILEYLNANSALQAAYAKYLPNLQCEADFNHRQALKLDSLTSNYYFYNPTNAQPMNYNGNGVNFYGDRRIRLFLEEIYDQQKHMEMVDQRLQLATAPVTLENHFAMNPNPVNGRLKYLLLFLVLSWIAGCVLAALIDNRLTIKEWFKSNE